MVFCCSFSVLVGMPALEAPSCLAIRVLSGDRETPRPAKPANSRRPSIANLFSMMAEMYHKRREWSGRPSANCGGCRMSRKRILHLAALAIVIPDILRRLLFETSPIDWLLLIVDFLVLAAIL